MTLSAIPSIIFSLRQIPVRVFYQAFEVVQIVILGSLGFVPGGGLRACPTTFIMPLPIKRCELYCSGVIPRGLSSLACHLAANCCSKRNKSCSPPLHALIALRAGEREEAWGPPFWHGRT